MIDELMASQAYQMSLHLLDATALRHEAIAANIANLETPGYKRIDLSPDFDTQLAAFAERPDSASLDAIKPTLAQDLTATSVRPDGNNVEMDRELIEMNRNSAAYDFLTVYASDSLKRLKTAITGRNA